MMKIVAKTDIGKARNENQDNYRAGRQSDDTVWAVVCDGMGGARGGAFASSMAVTAFEAEFVKGLVPGLPAAGVRSLMETAANRANHEIYELAQQDEDKHGMGTTLVALVLKDGLAHIIHAGDSRAYLYRDGWLERLTRDHSMVQELVENGSLTPEEAEVHPNKNLITRAVGVGPELAVEYSERQMRPEDTLLLCSDGLTNAVTEEELSEIIKQSDFFDTASAMVQQALAAGGKDNITAVLVQVDATKEQ
ncbi:MAG: family protein phosphatase [Clostridiales bacterium]|jgi:protein phosphatase|nr:family protein phosphatase [Clostridiales bacterium]